MVRKRRTTATKKRTTTRTPARRRRTSTAKKSSSGIVNFFVPMFFIFCILFCLGFLLFMGYRTATASAFFDIEKVELEGVENLPTEKLKNIVKTHTVKTGVWNADLDAIKADIKRFKYAKEISVSRVLPDSIKIIVDERKPVAIVRLDGKDYWADEDALILDRVSAEEKRPAFLMTGWDEADTDKAQENNKKRIQLYQELLREWKDYSLAERVIAVNLSDLKDPQAIVADSGQKITISLGRENYKKRLQKALEVIAGKGKRIESVITSGVNPIIGYRDS
jgi:cell division septal protein FtsQ